MPKKIRPGFDADTPPFPTLFKGKTGTGTVVEHTPREGAVKAPYSEIKLVPKGLSKAIGSVPTANDEEEIY